MIQWINRSVERTAPRAGLDGKRMNERFSKAVVSLNADLITNHDSFHDVFADLLGFPDFYGRNMNAWIDCMTSLDCPDDGMTKVHAVEGGVLTIEIENYAAFKNRCPDEWLNLIECSAFVNHARIEDGEAPVLALSFHK